MLSIGDHSSLCPLAVSQGAAPLPPATEATAPPGSTPILAPPPFLSLSVGSTSYVCHWSYPPPALELPGGQWLHLGTTPSSRCIQHRPGTGTAGSQCGQETRSCSRMKVLAEHLCASPRGPVQLPRTWPTRSHISGLVRPGRASARPLTTAHAGSFVTSAPVTEDQETRWVGACPELRLQRETGRKIPDAKNPPIRHPLALDLAPTSSRVPVFGGCPSPPSISETWHPFSCLEIFFSRDAVLVRSGKGPDSQPSTPPHSRAHSREEREAQGMTHVPLVASETRHSCTKSWFKTLLFLDTWAGLEPDTHWLPGRVWIRSCAFPPRTAPAALDTRPRSSAPSSARLSAPPSLQPHGMSFAQPSSSLMTPTFSGSVRGPQRESHVIIVVQWLQDHTPPI
ncbi:hypothetical protein MUG91_G244n99 [Manis pentadactyla]|nr:hypothetical protein MUG91_G244n99 [Manis pentadactyla]